MERFSTEWRRRRSIIGQYNDVFLEITLKKAESMVY